MCDNWGYQRLHQAVENRARQEMHHAGELIARIIFLEGTPTVSRLNQIHIGPDVPMQLHADHEAEVHTVGLERGHSPYGRANDAATRDILESIVKKKTRSPLARSQLPDDIAQLGVPLYSSNADPRQAPPRNFL